MTSINNNQRSSRSSSPAPTNSTTNTSAAKSTEQTSSAVENDGVEPTPLENELEMSLDATSGDDQLDLVSKSTSRSKEVAATAKRELADFIVFDGDVEKVVRSLELLPPAEKRAALEAMQEDGSFSTLLKEADGPWRRRLTNMLFETGLVSSETPDAPHRNGLRAPEPPPPPELAVIPENASEELKAMLHDENIARASDYRDQHQKYVEAYRVAIRHAPDAKSLRELGAIAEPNLPAMEPGTSDKSDQSEWAQQATRYPDKETNDVVTSRLYQLRGLRPPPGGDANLAGSFKLGYGENNAVAIGGSASKDRYGATTSSTTLGADIALGKEGALYKTSIGGTTSTDADGKETRTTGVKGSVQGSRTRDAKGVDDQPVKDSISAGIDPATGSAHVNVQHGSTKVNGAIGTNGATMKVDSQHVKLEATIEKDKQVIAFDIAGAKLGLTSTPQKLVGTIGAEGVAFTMGYDANGGIITDFDLEKRFELGDFSVEVTVAWGQTIQLSSQEDLRAFISIIEGGVFETPPELERGMKWSQLSDGAKEAYTLFGWTGPDWDGARKNTTSSLNALRAGGR